MCVCPGVLRPAHPVALQVPHLDLQQGQVSQDLQVVLVPLQGVTVALDGLVVLLVGALQQAVHVPAWERVKGQMDRMHTNTLAAPILLRTPRLVVYNKASIHSL